MRFNIAIVGTGPTGIYTAKYLIEKEIAAAITLYESQSESGKGTPYHQDWNSEIMLSNIASIEIPPVTKTLVEWLHQQTELTLARIGINRGQIDERAFYPRVALGEYFHDELNELINLARGKNIAVNVLVNHRVEDVLVEEEGVKLIVKNKNGILNRPVFSHAVLATGHAWPTESEIHPGYFSSPWPISALKTIGNCHVGILGTSLSAIDAVVALADARGSFEHIAKGELVYFPEPGTEKFKISLMSRKGILPEADFYHTIPYLPLKICTPERVSSLIEAHPETSLLDAIYELFKAELILADPAYAAAINLKDLDVKEFAAAYFSERQEADPFAWAAQNLEEAKINQQRKFTVEWRYAILRMHEVIGQAVRYFSAEDFQSFKDGFKNVFVDDYATVPHESIARLLALHKAGKLEVLKLGSDYKLEKASIGATVAYDGQDLHFPAFIEATGQRALTAKDFPFPSLLERGIIKDAAVISEGNENKKAKGKKLKIGGIALDMVFHPISDSLQSYRLYCPSIPFMLGQFPFAQGITSSHEIGKIIAEDLAAGYMPNSVAGNPDGRILSEHLGA